MDTPLIEFLRRLADDVALTGLPFRVDVRADGGTVIVLPNGWAITPEVLGDAPDLVDVAGLVCDLVMGELGHGWPELADGHGRFVALLTPSPAAGDVVWVAGDHGYRVGGLGEAPLVTVRSR